MQLGQDIKQTAGYTTANSWYNYGEWGEKEAIAYLNQNLPPDGVAIVRKDIGYYLRVHPRGSLERKWIYSFLFTLPISQGRAKFEELMEKYDIEYVQLDSVCSPQKGYEIIKPYFVFDKRFGDFIIFRKM